MIASMTTPTYPLTFKGRATGKNLRTCWIVTPRMPIFETFDSASRGVWSETCGVVFASEEIVHISE